jgi:hypothetical protein
MNDIDELIKFLNIVDLKALEPGAREWLEPRLPRLKKGLISDSDFTVLCAILAAYPTS